MKPGARDLWVHERVGCSSSSTVVNGTSGRTQSVSQSQVASSARALSYDEPADRSRRICCESCSCLRHTALDPATASSIKTVNGAIPVLIEVVGGSPVWNQQQCPHTVGEMTRRTLQ